MKKVYIYDIAENKIKNNPGKKLLIALISIVLSAILIVLSVFYITRNRVNTSDLQSAFNAYNSLVSREISVVSKLFEDGNNLFYYNADAVLRKTCFKDTKKDDVFINKENKLRLNIHKNSLQFKENSADFDVKDTVMKQKDYLINRSQAEIPDSNFATVTFSFDRQMNLYSFIDLYYKQLNDLYLQKDLYLNSTAVKTSENENDIALNLRGQIYAFDEYLQKQYNYDTDFTARSSSKDIFENEKNVFNNILDDCMRYENYASMLHNSGIYTNETVDFISAREYVNKNGYKILGFTVTGKTEAIKAFMNKNPGLYIAASK